MTNKVKILAPLLACFLVHGLVGCGASYTSDQERIISERLVAATLIACEYQARVHYDREGSAALRKDVKDDLDGKRIVLHDLAFASWNMADLGDFNAEKWADFYLVPSRIGGIRLPCLAEMNVQVFAIQYPNANWDDSDDWWHIGYRFKDYTRAAVR